MQSAVAVDENREMIAIKQLVERKTNHFFIIFEAL